MEVPVMNNAVANEPVNLIVNNAIANEHPIEQINIQTVKEILDVVKDESAHTDEQYKNIDYKISIFITLQAGLLAFIAQSIIIPDISNITLNRSLFFILFCYAVSSLATIVLLLISIFNFSKILHAKEYKRVNINEFDDFNNNPLRFREIHELYSALIDAYVQNINHNRKANEEKQNIYKHAVNLTIISIITLLASYVIRYFI